MQHLLLGVIFSLKGKNKITEQYFLFFLYLSFQPLKLKKTLLFMKIKCFLSYQKKHIIVNRENKCLVPKTCRIFQRKSINIDDIEISNLNILLNTYVFIWDFTSLSTLYISRGQFCGHRNLYIQLVKALNCQLPTIGKELPTF